MSYFKKYKFDKSQFKLGMRTFKTGIAVFLVLLIFWLFWLERSSNRCFNSRF
ncbi:hypothetical protein SMI10712_00293 [Streptococcus mitis]|uniref:Uncharacterized protein n=1 Tax=Streptococcus mitis TaxID=28037 RepID=A0A150NNW1_STRMT|nr:hypothetical protein SMI10712_00293 [Streptococcus mitis]